RRDVPQAAPQQLDLDTALELMQRLQQEFADLIAIYHELPGRLSARPERGAANWSYSPKTPGIIALVAGLRAAAALLILALAWYGLNWPSAAGAVILTVVFCALASSSPFPEQMIRSTTEGFALAIPFAFVCAFYMLNHVEGYLMLVLSMAPFLAMSTYATTWRRTLGIGTGFNLMFAQIIAPENMMRFNVANFFNDSIAQIVGLALAVLMFALILPEHRQGSRRHIAEALWGETLRLCFGERPQMRQHFESRVRDLLNQLSMGIRGPASPAVRLTLNQAIVLLEMGHAILDLRTLDARWPAGHAVRAAQENCIAVLAAYLRQPLPIRHAQALAATTVATNALRAHQAQVLAGRDEAIALQRGLTDLHLIGASLQDPSLQASAIASAMPKESVHHAA
ncbi:MAG TPA: FUSC family protein, partial [Oxalicibacterium sp.]|nr:FUSC family protein [Oxalicibacterium sp.]